MLLESPDIHLTLHCNLGPHFLSLKAQCPLDIGNKPCVVIPRYFEGAWNNAELLAPSIIYLATLLKLHAILPPAVSIGCHFTGCGAYHFAFLYVKLCRDDGEVDPPASGQSVWTLHDDVLHGKCFFPFLSRFRW